MVTPLNQEALTKDFVKLTKRPPVEGDTLGTKPDKNKSFCGDVYMFKKDAWTLPRKETMAEEISRRFGNIERKLNLIIRHTPGLGFPALIRSTYTPTPNSTATFNKEENYWTFKEANGEVVYALEWKEID